MCKLITIPPQKMSRIIWLEEGHHFVTTGFDKTNSQQIFLWDRRTLSSGPYSQTSLGTTSGILVPFFDVDTRMLYLVGKGDSSVQFYEVLGSVGRGVVFIFSE
jgi:hypothetical protein